MHEAHGQSSGPGTHTEVEGLIDNLFRRSAGRIVSYLTRLLGPEHLELAEESVQEALIKALQSWPYSGVPNNPGGWLFQVAKNTALDAARRNSNFASKHPEIIAELDQRAARAEQFDAALEEQLRDDELRMLLMCCHPAL